MDRVEIAPRGHRDPGLGQEAPAESDAVAGQRRYIDIEIKSALGRGEAGQPGIPQHGDQPVAIGAVARDMAVELGMAAEHRQGGELRQRRRRDVEILRQAFDRARQIRWHHHPAEPPAGHAVIFRERVDDDRVGAERTRGLRRLFVGNAVINLIRDEADLPLPAILR